ncbi:hypothetical protein ACFL1X_00380 [Candidatus Hydrogenedentota bacterium]
MALSRKKKIVAAIAVIVILIPIVIIVVLSLTLDGLVKTGVTKFVPKITGTDVQLSSVDLSPLSGSGGIRKFVLGNPEGFKTDSAFAVKSIDVSVDVGSVFSDKIIINEILIDKAELTYELGGKGSNIGQIIENAKSFGGHKDEKESTEDSADTGGGKKVVIKRLLLTGATVNLSATLLGGKAASISLPPIELTNIGKDSGGATPAEAITKVFSAILDAITVGASDVGVVLEDGAKILEEGAEVIEEGVETVVDTAADALKGVGGLFK